MKIKTLTLLLSAVFVLGSCQNTNESSTSSDDSSATSSEVSSSSTYLHPNSNWGGQLGDDIIESFGVDIPTLGYGELMDYTLEKDAFNDATIFIHWTLGDDTDFDKALDTYFNICSFEGWECTSSVQRNYNYGNGTYVEYTVYYADKVISEDTGIEIQFLEGGVIGTLEIEVYAKSYPTTVTVSGEASATVGDKVQLSVTLNPTDVSETAVTWSSSNSSIAGVDKNGLVTCNGAGEVVISATAANGTTKGDFTISVSAGASVIPSASAGTYTGSDTYANDISVEILENGKLTFVNITYDNTYEFTFSEVNADGYYVFTCEGEVDLVFELTGSSIIYHGDVWFDSNGGICMMDETEYSK